MRRKDDVLWKGILEDVFDDFLRFLNPDAGSLLDLDKGFEFLDKELQQVFPPENDEFSPKVVDKLVSVFTKSGDENPEINSKFEQAVEVLTERSTTMGIEELLLDRARKEGKEEGKEEGSHDKAVAVAKEMIKDGISVEQIAKFTKLTIKEIENL